jgi:non-ribosomal peptide synthetase component E (peptide arylation enzyme)
MKKIVLAVLSAISFSTPALATVDGMYQQTIVMSGIQSGDLCYAKMPVVAEFGIPEFVIGRAAVSPMMALYLSSGHPAQQLNMNVAATTPAMEPAFEDVFPYDPNVSTLKMTLDVSALAAANGNSVEGRTSTLQSAKAALLSVAKTLSESRSNGLFRLNMIFKGLPTQNDLSGTALPATTRYPYTGGSPVLKAIESELIKKECM